MAFSRIVGLVSLDVLEMVVVRCPQHRSRKFDISIKLPIAPSVQSCQHRCSDKSGSSRWHPTFLRILEARLEPRENAVADRIRVGKEILGGSDDSGIRVRL